MSIQPNIHSRTRKIASWLHLPWENLSQLVSTVQYFTARAHTSQVPDFRLSGCTGNWRSRPTGEQPAAGRPVILKRIALNLKLSRNGSEIINLKQLKLFHLYSTIWFSDGRASNSNMPWPIVDRFSVSRHLPIPPSSMRTHNERYWCLALLGLMYRV